MKTIVPGAIAGRPSRRQALVASGLALLASTCLRGTASAAVGDQEKWRFCDKCFEMFFDGSGEKGKCPADGAGHTAQGFAFFPHYDDSEPSEPDVQYGWHFCSKCFAMFYNGSTRGHCPSGGPHTAQGFNFGLNYAASAPPSSQTQWRFCQQCFALFYDGGAFKGRCPAGKTHVAQGFFFNLPYHAPVPGSLTDLLTYDDSITFPRGIAADVHSHVRLHSDGTVEFTSHFHDSGAEDYVYSISWAIVASDKTVAFTLQHGGKIKGHLFGGQSDRNSNYSEQTMYDLVGSKWPALVNGSTARMSAHVSGSLGGLLDTTKEALDSALKAATIYSEGSVTVEAVYNIPFLHNGL